MTSEERNHIISMRLQQAEECISDAEYCMADDRLALATNRVYYGMFYAMSALGVLKQFETSRHVQLIGWFNKHFVHTGILPNHFGRLVKKAFEARTSSDYQIGEVPTVNDLKVMLADMKLFISSIKAWIEEQQRKG